MSNGKASGPTCPGRPVPDTTGDGSRGAGSPITATPWKTCKGASVTKMEQLWRDVIAASKYILDHNHVEETELVTSLVAGQGMSRERFDEAIKQLLEVGTVETYQNAGKLFYRRSKEGGKP